MDLELGAGVAVLTDEAIRDADIKGLAGWISAQPPWSDFPFVLLTERGGGLERNPAAARQMEALGNVTFLERPFHPTTLISVVKTALRGRLRQYEARARLEALHESESHARNAEMDLRRLNETLEIRVAERAGEIEAANRQLVSQIEERERVEATLRQMQRLEAVGQLTSGVAHDFNNLLTVVLGNLGSVERRLTGSADGDLKQRLSHMRLAAERGATLTSQLLAFSRRQRLEPKAVDLNDALANMRDLLQSSLGGSVQFTPCFDRTCGVRLSIQPRWNWLFSISQSMPGTLVRSAVASRRWKPPMQRWALPKSIGTPPAGDYVVVSVTDTGSGMTKDVLAKAFEPFFTTKEIGKGSGLGLSQVLGFAKQSGGGMQIETRLGEGTCVKVYLPRAAGGDAAKSIDEVPQCGLAPPLTGAIILLVDDDNAVREIAALMLRDLGYVVIEVGSGGVCPRSPEP